VAANSAGLSCGLNMEQGNGSENQDSSNIGISKEQCDQLAYLLHQFQTLNTTENSGNMNNSAVNFAGITACTSSVTFDKLSCECHKTKPEKYDTKILHLKTKNLSSKIYILRIICKHSF